MFDSMDGHVVNAFVEVGLSHTVSVFFHEAAENCKMSILGIWRDVPFLPVMNNP
jgi:hypothetical protein